MKLAVSVFIICLSFITSGFCQDEKDVKGIDTLHLPELKFKKTLAYITPSVTIMIDYDNFMTSFNAFWRMYKKGMKSGERAKKKGDYISPDYARCYYLLDSMHTVLLTQVKERDTIYIEDITFARKGIGPGHDFTIDIDAGKCIILNMSGVPQRKIIRKKISYQKDHLNGWGGRKYYLINSKSSFLEGTDWIS